MNTLKTNTILITALNFFGIVAGALGGLYIISLIAKEDFIQLLKDPSMIVVIGISAAINAVYAFVKTNKLKKAVAAR